MNLTLDLNDQAATVHRANLKWWQDPATGQPIERNRFELLALAVTEVAEAIEGERKDLMDDKLPDRKMAEVEMADAYIRLLDYAAGFGYSLRLLPAWCCVPENKGQALHAIMKNICLIEEAGVDQGFNISSVLAFIKTYCDQHGYDLAGAITAKMEFNASRVDHSHEARLLAGGKKW
jgi:NTP pyrophosphatase (non-canonical NTP hydrolase)